MCSNDFFSLDVEKIVILYKSSHFPIYPRIYFDILRTRWYLYSVLLCWCLVWTRNLAIWQIAKFIFVRNKSEGEINNNKDVAHLPPNPPPPGRHTHRTTKTCPTSPSKSPYASGLWSLRNERRGAKPCSPSTPTPTR